MPKTMIAKVIAFSTVATLSSLVLKSDGVSNTVAIPTPDGIATVTLLASEPQGGVK